MSLTKKTFLGLFLGLGGLGWIVGVAMTLHANNLAQDNRTLSSALTSSLIQRASLVHQLEQLTAQQIVGTHVAQLQDSRAVVE